MGKRDIIFLVGLLAVMTASVLAGPAVEYRNTTANFGRVTQSKILTTDFWVKSTGDEPLVIEEIWPGCGCTEINLPDSSIAPGDSLSLRITFNTGHFRGLISKNPQIRTNASPEKVKLSIVAEVDPAANESWPISLRPDGLDVSQYGTKTRRMGKFHIENRSDEDFRVSVVDTALKAFEIRLPDDLKAGETIEGKVRVRDDRLESDFDESVTFMIEGKETYYYTLPVRRRYRPIE